MPKIHGLIYIAVGLFVSILSWRLDYNKLTFFFYAGLVFVLVGVIKLLLDLAKRKAGAKEKAHHRLHQIKYCPKCGNATKLHDRFCSRCGAMV